MTYADRGPGTPILEAGSPFWHVSDRFGEPLKGMTAHERGQATELALLLNQAREAEGLTPLLPDSFAEAAARVHAADRYRRSFSGHKSPEGWTVVERLTMVGGVGSEAHAECLASAGTGVFTAAQAVGGWLYLPRTRQLLLSPDATHVGGAYDHEGRMFGLVVIAR